MDTRENREIDDLLEEAKELLGQNEKQPMLRAEDIQIDYSKFYDDMPPQTDEPSVPTPQLTAYEQSKPAYQTAKQNLKKIERELKKQQNRQQEHPKEHKRQNAGPKEVPKVKKSRFSWLIWIVIVIAALFAAFLFLAKQPVGDASRARKEGCSTILLVGTDAGGYRTDTMMLLSVNKKERAVRLVSVPRDTLVFCSYSVPKLNSAYGWAGGGKDGMEELTARLEDILGFRVDGYLLVDLSVFEKLVNAMGGVRFDVPVDMHYSDPSQDLNIDLSAGMQNLNGKEAIQLVRFRSGYADADLGRVCVQRDFISAALSQWISLKGLLHLPQALMIFSNAVEGNLNLRNDLWLAQAILLGKNNIESQTLPGSAGMILGGSYYLLDEKAVLDCVNNYLNPYEEAIRADALSIRVG